MKQLPLGRQSFEDLRSSDCLYVDKTEIIHRIIPKGKVYSYNPDLYGKCEPDSRNSVVKFFFTTAVDGKNNNTMNTNLNPIKNVELFFKTNI